MLATPRLVLLVVATALGPVAACASSPAVEPAAPSSPGCTAEQPPVVALINLERAGVYTGRLREALELRQVCRQTNLTLVIESAAAVTAEHLARLTRLGARAPHPVAVAATDGVHRRVEALEPAAPSTMILAILPGDALPFVAELPWVTALWIPDVHPPLPIWPDEIRNKLALPLRSSLHPLPATPYPVVSAAASTEGCIDAAQRDLLAGMGVIVMTVVPDTACADHGQIFTLVTPVPVLEDLAALPWIQVIEGGGQFRAE